MTFLLCIIYIGVAIYFASNGHIALAVIALIASLVSTNIPVVSDRFIKIRDGRGVDHYINAKYIIKIRRYDGKEAKIFSIRDDEYTIGEKEWNEVRKTFKIKEPFKEWKK